MIDIAKLRKLRPYALSNAAADELASLQAAKTAALKVADERSMQNTELRQENERLRATLSSCKNAMEHSNANGGRTDWRHMIAAIEGAVEQTVREE